MRTDLPLNALQKGIYQILHKAETVPTFDFIPKGQEQMPYIWLGEQTDKMTERNKNIVYHEITQRIHIWSNASGKKECNDIMNEVIYLLTNFPIEVEGHSFISCELDSASISGDLYEGGMTAYHGVLDFAIVIEQ